MGSVAATEEGSHRGVGERKYERGGERKKREGITSINSIRDVLRLLVAARCHGTSARGRPCVHRHSEDGEEGKVRCSKGRGGESKPTSEQENGVIRVYKKARRCDAWEIAGQN
jgi:hypothetical protein